MFCFKEPRPYLPMCSRKTIAEAIFLSVLGYGVVIYRHAAVITLKPLDAVYHSALRFIAWDADGIHLYSV